MRNCASLLETELTRLLSCDRELYTERGSLLSTAIFVYAATSPVNGYFGGR